MKMTIKPPKSIKAVSITKYLKEHESYMLSNITTEKPRPLQAYHQKQIAYMQHERIIHLIVLCFTTLSFLLGLCLALWSDIILVYLLCLIVGILDIFYMLHYFRLENAVQRWYLIDQTLDERLKKEITPEERKV